MYTMRVNVCDRGVSADPYREYFVTRTIITEMFTSVNLQGNSNVTSSGFVFVVYVTVVISLYSFLWASLNSVAKEKTNAAL